MRSFTCSLPRIVSSPLWQPPANTVLTCSLFFSDQGFGPPEVWEISTGASYRVAFKRYKHREEAVVDHFLIHKVDQIT